MATNKPLQTITLTSNVSSVTFSGIDQSYTDLIFTYVGTVSANQQVTFRFNGSSSSYYSFNRFVGDGSAISSDKSNNASSIYISAGAVANLSNAIYHINGYSNTTTYKPFIGRWNNPGANLSEIQGLWRGSTGSSTEAITSITVDTLTSDTFLAGSTFSLYGIKSGAPQALGGDVVTTDGTYWYHAFKSTQTFTPLKALTVDYLVVAGGGAGGSAGGGGGGGYRTSIGGSALSLTGNTSYTCTVGAGGAYVAGGTNPGGSGTNSIFGSISATGGGGGGAYTSSGTASIGLSGGSGGGGGFYDASGGSSAGGSGNAGSYSPVEGYAGGTGATNATPKYLGAGGGGAGAVGGGISAPNAGAGGAGILNTLYLGNSYYWAGGGGGGAQNGPGANPAIGGNGGIGGGGGGGSLATTGTGGGSALNAGVTPSGRDGGNGGTNTGGGGGADAVSLGNSGSGGSGIVIVRYAV
jgi:hypothetical protein